MRRRRELGLRQRDVAIRLGVNTWTYLLWEHDKTRPVARLLPAIIAFLGHDPAPVPHSLAGRMVAMRRRQGLTRKSAATLLGVDEATLRRWEIGSSEPRGRHAALVAAFLTGEGNGPP